MTFFDVKHHSNIELTQEEMLTISRDISLRFSPNPALLVGSEDLSHDTHSNSFNPKTVNTHANFDLTSIESGDFRFSTQELNSISEEISRDFAPKPSIIEPELFLLPVDPHHLYIYWDFGHIASNPALGNEAPPAFILRVYWHPDSNSNVKSSNVWFDLAADRLAHRIKVRLPLDDSIYSACLGKFNQDHSFEALAFSNFIHVPPAPGRTQITTLIHKPNDQLAKANPQTEKIAPITTQQSQANFFDEMTLPKSQAQGIFYEKQNNGESSTEPGWFVKFHFSPSFIHDTYINKIDSRLMTLFKQKGINVELIPEPEFIESSKQVGKSASGLGI
jgi:hypothetical protein